MTLVVWLSVDGERSRCSLNARVFRTSGLGYLRHGGREVGAPELRANVVRLETTFLLRLADHGQPLLDAFPPRLPAADPDWRGRVDLNGFSIFFDLCYVLL